MSNVGVQNDSNKMHMHVYSTSVIRALSDARASIKCGTSRSLPVAVSCIKSMFMLSMPYLGILHDYCAEFEMSVSGNFELVEIPYKEPRSRCTSIGKSPLHLDLTTFILG